MSPKLDQPMSRLPVGRVRGLGNCWGVLDGQRGPASVWEIRSHPKGYWMCAVNSELSSLPGKEEERTWLSVFVFYVNPTCRWCWRQHLVCGSLYSWPCWCALSVSLGYMLRVSTGWTRTWESSSCIHWPKTEISGYLVWNLGTRRSYWAPKLLEAEATSKIHYKM